MASSSKSFSFNPNKHMKEEFVSNLDGSSMIEISALLSIIPIIVLLRHSISSYRPKVSVGGGGDKDTLSKKRNVSSSAASYLGSYIATLTADFLLMVLPILLCFTILSEWTYFLIVPLILALGIIMVGKRTGSSFQVDRTQISLRANISSYRVATNVITCLCILAVDFRIFPRKYAKTETYGTSLMDLGVGSFIMANALVSRQARNISSANLKAALKNTSPLILLGFGRLLSMSGVDYQVHVAEYGVHWNFFFTLAAVTLLTSLINVPPQYCGILGIFILIGYQSWLLNGLNVYLLSSERGPNIIDQNKEGVFSIFGYWGMYLISVQLGHYLFFGSRVSGKLRSKQWTRSRLWVFALLFWLLTAIVDKHVERVSRRMCNMAYVTFVVAINLQVLAIFVLSDFVAESHSSALEDALNRNLLGYFLLANILTGVVNLLVDTLFASSFTALSILSVFVIGLHLLIRLLVRGQRENIVIHYQNQSSGFMVPREVRFGVQHMEDKEHMRINPCTCGFTRKDAFCSVSHLPPLWHCLLWKVAPCGYLVPFSFMNIKICLDLIVTPPVPCKYI